MQEISLLDMLKSGVHFGHQKSRWHPKMKPFIFGERSGVHIIDLEQTRSALLKAQEFIRGLTGRGGTVVFIGTKKQAQAIVKKYAETCGAPYVVNRWIGGLLTNFAVVKKLIERLATLKRNRAGGELEKYTKKEQADFSEEITRLETLIGGISELTRLPEAVFIVDLKIDKTALREARKKHVPIIAIADTNTDPSKVDYPIPANDDATKSIEYIMQLIAQAVSDGRKIAQTPPPATA